MGPVEEITPIEIDAVQLDDEIFKFIVEQLKIMTEEGSKVNLVYQEYVKTLKSTQKELMAVRISNS